MKKLLKKLSFKIISKLISLKEKYIEEELRKKVMIKENSKIYSCSKIYNLQNNKHSIKIEEKTHIKGELLVFKFGGKIKIGSNSFIGEGTRIWSGERIEIGNNVLISHNVNIIDTNSHEINNIERAQGYKNLLENGHSAIKGNIECKSIIIQDYAWINFNASILKGVRIGQGAIVAAGSIVTKDVPEFTLVAGNPAKVIKHLNQ